jgi:hypothetical protein
MKKSLLGLIILVALSSCSKDNIESNPATETTLYNSKTCNSDYDKYGIRHNQYLNEISDYANLDNLNSFEIFQISTEIIYQEEQAPTWNEFSAQLSYLDLLSPNSSANETVNLLLNDEVITEDELPFINDLAKLIDITENQEYTSFQFSEKLNVIENKIISHCDIQHCSESERGNYASKLLAAISIARHSYDYWYTAVNDETHPWHNIATNQTKGPWGFIKRVARDFWGFIASGQGGISINSDTGINVDLTWNITSALKSASQASSAP